MMDDLIRRQDALDEVERLAKFFMEKWHEYAPSTIAVTDAIKAIPSARSTDAVEVVQCYKCIHWDEDTVRRNSNDATWWNEAVCRKYSDDIWDAWKDADWFCADGERKTDG